MTTEPIDACAAAIAGVLISDRSWDRLSEYDQQACREAARACLEAQWQPIETAPKDGTVVDLFAEGRRVANCQFLDGRWHCPTGRPKRWWLITNPTHWMPLSAPPAAIDAITKQEST